MNDIYCINCGVAYLAVKVMKLWNNRLECKISCGHTWSRVREDGLGEAYKQNDPERGALDG